MNAIVYLFLVSPWFSFAQNQTEISSLKKQIVSLAESYAGQGDPDFSKQKSLEFLVNQLIAKNPMTPVKDRLALLNGVWKQVWGPYDYRNDDRRGIDPELGTEEIYQVVSKEGYYYNVSPLYKNGDRGKERIGLLRGEFSLDEKESDKLNVKFTRYPGVKPRPRGVNIWELAAQAEAGTLNNEITIVPTIIVRLFFNSGSLREIYTDSDLRLVYGSSNKADSKPSLYVMTRVQ